MIDERHRLVAELEGLDGEPLGRAALAPDWVPAEEWLRLEGLRRGRRPLAPDARLVLEPVWDRRRGPPVLARLRLAAAVGRGALCVTVGRDYLEPAVRRAAAERVRTGRLREGAPYRYRLLAFARPRAPALGPPAARAGEAAPDLVAEEVEVPIVAGDVARTAARSHERGAELAAAGDLPVFVHRRVIAEALRLAARDPRREVGGILIGALHRDGEGGDLHLEVSAVIRARHTVAEAGSVTFTAATWAAAEAAIRLRGRGEAAVGWVHSHPLAVWPCRRCPRERWARCAAARPFFSEADVRLHRAVFSAAHNVALLVTTTGQRPEPSVDLFGWRRGRVVARGYHVVAPAPRGTDSDEAGATP